MTSRERVRAAMHHETPDRVPVMCQLALGHYFIHGDASPTEIWFDSETLATTMARVQQRYGFDGFLINLPGRPANWREYITSEDQTADPSKLIWSNGLETIVPADDNLHTFLPNNQPLPRANYQTVNLQDPATYRIPGLVWNTWHAPSLWDISDDADLSDPKTYPDWLTLTLRTARAANPDASIHAEVFSPFTYLMELFGYENSLMALIDSPEICHALLEKFTAQVTAMVQCFAPCEPDAILISSAFAGAGFISRAMYAEFVVPYEKQIAHAIAAFNIPSYTHTCGAIGDRLDLMAETDINGVDTLDPPPLGTVDFARAKAEFGQRFFFKGNLDAVNEMLRADDTTFEQAVRDRLRIGMTGSGYILSSACSVAPHVKPERLVRMVELAKEYGRYA